MIQDTLHSHQDDQHAAFLRERDREMDRPTLMQWGASYSYPLMVLSSEPLVVLGGGWECWFTLLTYGSQQVLDLLRERILYWESSRFLLCESLD